MNNVIMIIPDNVIDLAHIAENILFVGFYMIDLSIQRFDFIV